MVTTNSPAEDIWTNITLVACKCLSLDRFLTPHQCMREVDASGIANQAQPHQLDSAEQNGDTPWS